jgi:hypothetical protein
LQLDQVLASGLLTLHTRPSTMDLELLATSLSNGGNGGSSAPRMTRKAQVAELHREAQPIGVTRRCRMMERSLSLNV